MKKYSKYTRSIFLDNTYIRTQIIFSKLDNKPCLWFQVSSSVIILGAATINSGRLFQTDTTLSENKLLRTSSRDQFFVSFFAMSFCSLVRAQRKDYVIGMCDIFEEVDQDSEFPFTLHRRACLPGCWSVLVALHLTSSTSFCRDFSVGCHTHVRTQESV